MKYLLKIILSLIIKVGLIPIFIIYYIHNLFSKDETLYYSFAQFLSIFPGLIGNYIRREYYKFTLKQCANSSCICFGSIIVHPDTEIGNNVYIGLNSMIGSCIIEDDVLIGSNVDLIDGGKQHTFNNTNIPIRMQSRKITKIKIGKDCWIGNSSVIMADVNEGSVIGAGSVVVKKIDSYSIAVGNPAKIIKKRNYQQI